MLQKCKRKVVFATKTRFDFSLVVYKIEVNEKSEAFKKRVDFECKVESPFAKASGDKWKNNSLVGNKNKGK